MKMKEKTHDFLKIILKENELKLKTNQINHESYISQMLRIIKEENNEKEYLKQWIKNIKEDNEKFKTANDELRKENRIIKSLIGEQK